MKLTLQGLELEATLVERAQSLVAYEDWCRLDVNVVVPHFRGHFDWSATLTDLDNLARIFQTLHSTVGSETTITFEPVEPNVSFVFRPDATGHVVVDYEFIAQLETGPRLAGSCQFDQTDLPAMLRKVHILLADARPN